MTSKNTLCCHGVHHLAIKVADFDRVVNFYTEGLGGTVALAWGEGDGRAVMLSLGKDNFVEIFAGGAAEKPEGAVLHFALRTDDCDAAFQRALAAGAVATMEPKEIPIPGTPHPAVVRIAFVTSPGGEIVEFFQSQDI